MYVASYCCKLKPKFGLCWLDSLPERFMHACNYFWALSQALPVHLYTLWSLQPRILWLAIRLRTHIKSSNKFGEFEGESDSVWSCSSGSRCVLWYLRTLHMTLTRLVSVTQIISVGCRIYSSWLYCSHDAQVTDHACRNVISDLYPFIYRISFS